ncbi:hypothetical protein H3H37_23040 [Duganella sp. LX20W]|uniref:Flp family type IVb pilin n=1 Tax=Rugamonas brunnea TaxID=2758569 RepID=A0A7W2EWN1_9BURK|nr:hypothetical protein [Rugamonas brunnea]MBA5639940.1 hypothetical protein [Rugamonas brunnea]
MREIDPSPTPWQRFVQGESGATFYETVLVASLIAVVCVIVLLALGKNF